MHFRHFFLVPKSIAEKSSAELFRHFPPINDCIGGLHILPYTLSRQTKKEGKRFYQKTFFSSDYQYAPDTPAEP